MPEKSEAQRGARSGAREAAAAIRSDLEGRGVSEEFARAVSEQLAPFAGELPHEQHEAVLAGVALAFGVHRRAVATYRRAAADLDEVQRLVAAFASELEKLDEALEILAAYAARLRAQTGTGPARTLH
jgi:hypothetical protein